MGEPQCNQRESGVSPTHLEQVCPICFGSGMDLVLRACSHTAPDPPPTDEGQQAASDTHPPVGLPHLHRFTSTVCLSPLQVMPFSLSSLLMLVSVRNPHPRTHLPHPNTEAAQALACSLLPSFPGSRKPSVTPSGF